MACSPSAWHTENDRRMQCETVLSVPLNVDSVGNEYKQLAYEFKHIKIRASPPEWDFPTVLWRTLFFPNHKKRSKYLGIGATEEVLLAPNFELAI